MFPDHFIGYMNNDAQWNLNFILPMNRRIRQQQMNQYFKLHRCMQINGSSLDVSTEQFFCIKECVSIKFLCKWNQYRTNMKNFHEKWNLINCCRCLSALLMSVTFTIRDKQNTVAKRQLKLIFRANVVQCTWCE